jgi:hypothetical protein
MLAMPSIPTAQMAAQLPPRPTAQLRAPKVPTLDIAAVQPSQASALDGSDGWVFEDDYEERHVDGEVVPTTYFERSEPLPVRGRPRYLLALGAGAAAIAVIVALAMHGSSSTPLTLLPTAATAETPVPTPTTVVAPTPVVATTTPTVAAPVTTAATASPVPIAPTLTTLPITSWPNGATVTLVDNGTATVLGRTPVNAALDPSHSYDVVLAVVGRPTIVKHVDLATMHELAVDLDPEPAAVTAHVAAPTPASPMAHVAAAHAPAPEHHHHHQTGLAIATPDFATAPPKPKQVAAATPAGATGNGVLMISTKPPCEIVIDGKPTKLMTPQRALAVPSGTHTVTLINAQIGIRKQFGVKVDAKKPTKLIEDFTKG